MKFSQRMNLFKPSATLALNDRVLELRSSGVEIANLVVGDPDFNTPEFIKNAAKKALDENFTHYTPVPGSKELREALTAYLFREYGVKAGTENVAVSTGGKQALFNVLMSIVDAGDEVIIPVPYWTSYPDMVALAGAVPVFAPSPASRGFRITPEDLEKARTSRTRALILNSPSNPTGVTYDSDEMTALLDWAKRHEVFVIADEVYDQLVYPPAVRASACTWWKENQEHVAIVNALSKKPAEAFVLVQKVVGIVVLIRQCMKVQSQVTSNPCSITQAAASAALKGDFSEMAAMREAFMRRRDMAWAEISSWDGVVCPRPEGAFYLFPDVSALYNEKMPDDAAFCRYMLDEARVALTPGSAFGDPRCVRFSYSVADDVLESALHRVKKALYA